MGETTGVANTGGAGAGELAKTDGLGSPDELGMAPGTELPRTGEAECPTEGVRCPPAIENDMGIHPCANLFRVFRNTYFTNTHPMGKWRSATTPTV
jgi:hypothetical protein